MSFLDIMREQEDERVARRLHKFYCAQDTVQQQSNVQGDGEDMIIPEASQILITPQQQLDADLAFVQQLQDDELLAYYLQKQELVDRDSGIDEQSTLKTLTPLEYKLYNFQFGIDDPKMVTSNPIEEETEYNYTEPFELEQNKNANQIEPQVLYDPAQRKEDKEIAHVPKRMIEKRVNSMPVAMHHRDYATRNKGKALNETYKKITKLKPKTNFIQIDQRIDLPVQNHQHTYGYILKVLGNTRFIVFCYTNCSEKLCRITGKMRYRNIMLFRGDIVLLKLRDYQDSKADIVYKYSNKEYNLLLAEEELKDCDPRKALNADVFRKLLSYLDKDSRANLLSVYTENENKISYVSSTETSSTASSKSIITFSSVSSSSSASSS